MDFNITALDAFRNFKVTDQDAIANFNAETGNVHQNGTYRGRTGTTLTNFGRNDGHAERMRSASGEAVCLTCA